MKPFSIPEQCIREVNESLQPLLYGKESYVRKMPGREDSDAVCFSVDKQNERYFIKTSYFVGIDWITDKLTVQVRPKLESESGYIDYIKMLEEALCESENANHLNGLLTIDFKAKPIPIEKNEDMLSPFIVTLFIITLRSAVRSGLRQSYYKVSNNLKSKVKGRIQVQKTISMNHCKGDIYANFCEYQEYGINSEENKILKKALSISSLLLSSYRGGFDIETLKKTIAQIYPYFQGVDDNYDISHLRAYKANPIYKDYFKALKYGILILKHHSYGFNHYSKQIDYTPPYWIDMSKLFELYVYRELRRLYKAPNEVIYHLHLHKRELDYLLNPRKGTPMIIDAKYKPRYHTNGLDIEDIRQISAYARMKDVYSKLHIDEDHLIDCLIIYANQECNSTIPAPFDEIPLKSVAGYSKFYKWGIRLPMRK